MTYRSPKNRLLTTVLAGALMPATAFAAVASLSTAADAAVTKASCQVHAVLLKKEGDGTVPADLEFLKPTLKNEEFENYKGYELIERKALKLAIDTKSESTFAIGHKVGLTLLGGDEHRLKLHADLSSRDGTKSLLSTDYSIEDNGLLMIGAGAYSDDKRSGKLFFAIQCGRTG
jgi:hypothetical protein